jgi:hypothetical protein
MTAGRIYIPRHTLSTHGPEHTPASEAMAAIGFVFALAATIGAFSLMLAVGPVAWGSLR